MNTVTALVELMGQIGAVKAKEPGSYSSTVRLRLKYLVKSFKFKLKEAEEREARGRSRSGPLFESSYGRS